MFSTSIFGAQMSIIQVLSSTNNKCQIRIFIFYYELYLIKYLLNKQIEQKIQKKHIENEFQQKF